MYASAAAGEDFVCAAAAEIERVGKERIAFIERQYGRDISETSAYDLVVNLGTLSLEQALEIISHELWRKTMRFKDDTPYYNVDKDYISQHVEEYFYYQDYEQEDEEKEPIDVKDEPDDNEYGGFWYRKGYKSQEGLIGFYKKFGFVDEPKVHHEWNCYSCVPFPTMIRSL